MVKTIDLTLLIVPNTQMKEAVKWCLFMEHFVLLFFSHFYQAWIYKL